MTEAPAATRPRPSPQPFSPLERPRIAVIGCGDVLDVVLKANQSVEDGQAHETETTP